MTPGFMPKKHKMTVLRTADTSNPGNYMQIKSGFTRGGTGFYRGENHGTQPQKMVVGVEYPYSKVLANRAREVGIPIKVVSAASGIKIVRQRDTH